MASFVRPAQITYRRWRNPEQRLEVDFVAHGDESQGTESEICTVTAVTTATTEPAPGAASGPPTEETLTVEDALDAIGFGQFQWKMLLLTGLSWIADAMEMMILSILGPQLHCEWRLPSYRVALLTSVVFVGMGISSPLWGKLFDNYGRKVGLVICMCFTLFYGVLSSAASTYGWLLVLRGLVGFGIGGAPQSVTFYSEFLPAKRRGVFIMLIATFWAIGAVLEVLLALWVMPTLGWRWLLGLSTLPMAVFLCFSFWIPESPRFDMMAGRSEKALATLTYIAKQNGKAMPQGKIATRTQNDRGRFKDLFNPQNLKTTLLLWFIWFSNAFAYYGIILLTTEMFQAGDSCGATQGAKIEPRCSLACKYLTLNDYKDLLWTTFAEFPGLLLSIVAVEYIGRKKGMALCFFIFSLCILPLYACIGRTALTIFIFLARAFISGGYQIVFVYTPEVFPTEIRALAMGTSSASARVGALITPFVAQVLLRASVYLTLSMYCGICVLAGIASLILPIETLGRGLQESSPNQEAGVQAGSTSSPETGL